MRNINLETYNKFDIACQLLDIALDLFFDQRYFASLCLASVSEELLGRHLEVNGTENALKSEKNDLILAKKRIFNKDMSSQEAADFLNRSKNSIKHMSGGKDATLVMCPRYDAQDMIDRAITNYWRLEQEVTPKMEKFARLVED